MTNRIACLTAILLLTAIMIASIPTSAQAVDEPWPMFHQNPLHTGASTGTAPTNLAVKWKTNLNGAVVSSPAIAYGKVYVGSYDQKLYCLDAQTGTIQWSYPTNYKIRSTPAVKDGKVYLASDDGYVYCLDANTGALAWRFNTTSGIKPAVTEGTIYQIRSSPTVVDGRLYVGHLDTYVYCLNANTGAQIWKYKTGGTVTSSPAVAAGKVYIGSADSNLHCINANNGSVIWKYNTGSNVVTSGRREVCGSPTIVEDLNMVVFFANAYAVYRALNMNTGSLIWDYYMLKMRPYVYAQTTQAMTYVTPAYSKETSSFYVLDDHLAQRINAETGEPLWPLYGTPVNQEPEGRAKVPTGNGYGPGIPDDPAVAQPNHIGFINMASPAYADGKVYFGSHRESFFCFDATSLNGKRFSWYQTGGFVDSSPAIAYGYAYVGSYDWNLYCFTDGPARRMDPNDPTGTVPLLDATAITGTLSTTEVKVDDWISVEGKVEYQPNAIIWDRADVFATFTRPDGTTWPSNIMAEWDGTYKISFQPDMEGTWTVKPRWRGDTYNAGSEGTQLTFTVVSAIPPPAPPPPATNIIQGVPDLYLYAGIAVVVIIAILAIVLVWYRRK